MYCISIEIIAIHNIFEVRKLYSLIYYSIVGEHNYKIMYDAIEKIHELVEKKSKLDIITILPQVALPFCPLNSR